MPTYMGRDNTFLGRNATPTIGMQHINIKFYFYLCRKLHLGNL